MLKEILYLFNSQGNHKFKYLVYTPVWLCLVGGVFFSTFAAHLVAQRETKQAEAKFSQQADELTFALQAYLDDYTQVTNSLGAFYDASEQVTSKEFNKFAQQSLNNYAGILALGWIQKVPLEKRATYEQQMQAQGLANSGIWQLNSQQQSTTASKRREYFPHTYIEPLEEFSPFLGYDHNFELQRQLALTKARNNGVITTTKQIELIESGVPGFFMYRPVFSSEVAGDSLNGFVYTAFSLAEIVADAVQKLDLGQLNFNLYQTSVEQLDALATINSASLNDSFILAYSAQNQELTTDIAEVSTEPQSCPYTQNWRFCLRRLNLEGQEWSIFIVPTSEAIGTIWQAKVILSLGLILTFSLASYLWIFLNKSIDHENLFFAFKQAHLMSSESETKLKKRAAESEQLVTALKLANKISHKSELQLKKRTVELERTLHKLRQTQAQLVQTEKMSSLGQLVAGLAHEINNPVSFIYGNIDFANQYTQDLLEIVQLYRIHYPQANPEIKTAMEEIELDFLMQDFPRIMSSMKVGAKRIKEIVESMRNFSRMDQANMKPVDIHEGIDSTLMILRHRLKENEERSEIKVIRKYGNLPPVECHLGQLNQVFMNLLSNGIDAIEENLESNKQQKFTPPQIQIQTQRVSQNQVLIRIIDNGFGIPTEMQSRLFDPFFTTKPVGKGTGLGLSISYQIVTEFHQGKLECNSTPGKGAEFRIRMPIQQEKSKS